MSVDTRPAPAPAEPRLGPHAELVPASTMLVALSLPTGTCAVPLGFNVVTAPDWTVVVVLADARQVVDWVDHIERWDGVQLAPLTPLPLDGPEDTPVAEATVAWMGWRLLLRHQLAVPNLGAVLDVVDLVAPDAPPSAAPWPPADQSPHADLPAVAGGDNYTGR